LGGAGAAFGVYGKAKGGNWLWLGAAALPLFVGLLVSCSYLFVIVYFIYTPIL
jgi:ascorbate-specific PTS system EIIC-type component UlaA